MLEKYLVTSILLACSALMSNDLRAANNDHENTTFALAEITSITDGYFGAKRVYYTLKCNEIFTSTLTESTDSGALAVGILKEIQPRNCNTAPRQEWRRLTPEGRPLAPVNSFNEVWECRGICYIISDPEVDPHQKVAQYGTSERQARERLPCPPADQIEMVCRTIELAD